MIFLPLLKPVNKLCRLIIKGDDEKHQEIIIKELDTKAMKEFPSTGIQIAKEQVDVMFSYVIRMFDTLNNYMKKPNQNDGEYIHDLESSIDKIDRKLNEYLLLANKGDLSDSDLKLFSYVLRGCKDIERLGDYGENLITFFENAHERKIKFNDPIFKKITALNELSIKLINMTYDTYVKEDKQTALQIIEIRREYILQAESILDEYYKEIENSSSNQVDYINLVFSDIVSDYQRVYSHCSNIAKLFNNDKNYL